MKESQDLNLSTRGFLVRVLVLATLLSITYFGVAQPAIDKTFAAGEPVLQTFRSDTVDGSYTNGDTISLVANYDASLFPGSYMRIRLNTGVEVTLEHDGFLTRGAYTDDHIDAITLFGTNAYVADNAGNFIVLNLSDVNSISQTGTVATGADIHQLEYSSTKDAVYLANDSDGLQVVDVSTPATPALRDSVTFGDSVYDIDWTNLGVYIAAGTDGFAIVGDADLDNLLTAASSKGTEAYAIYFDGSQYLYVGTESGLEIYDGSPGGNRYNPVLQSDTSLGGQVSDLLVDEAEDILYAVIDGIGLKVVDVADATNPSVLTTVAAADGQRLTRNGDIIYVTDTDGTVDAVDIRTPASASSTYSYPVNDAAGVVMSGDRPVVANQFGLLVLQLETGLNADYVIEADGASVGSLEVDEIVEENVYSADGTAQATSSLAAISDIGGASFIISIEKANISRSRTQAQERDGSEPTGERTNTEPVSRNFNDGDGDGDGIPDSEQLESEQVVREILNNETGEIVDVFSSTISLETDRGPKCKVVRDFRNLAEEDVAVSEEYDFPLGLFDFTIECDESGSVAFVSIILDRPYDTSLWRYLKYDANTDTYVDVTEELEVQFVTQAFSRGDVTGSTVTKVRYRIEDGGPFDADGEANGVIVDPSGPALLAIVAQNLPSLSRPVVKSSTANKNTISLSFNDTLDVDEVPSPQAFSVKINGVLTAVESVKVIGGAVILQLSRDIPSGAEVTLDYQSRIGSIVGQKTANSVNSFDALEVVNITDSTDLVSKYRQCPVFTAIMRRGDRGSEVRQLQRFLNEQLDLPQPLTVDGVFGRGTEQAVILFQEAHQKDVLIDPWGEFNGSGYAYISTLAKMNQLSGCARTFASQPLILN